MNVSEKQIEQFVCFPESLDADERISIAKKISGDEELEELASFYLRYDDLFKRRIRNWE